jgi:hypothetical protein
MRINFAVYVWQRHTRVRRKRVEEVGWEWGVGGKMVR